MFSKVKDSDLDNISIQEEEIILNGPPTRMTGSIHIQNSNTNKTKIKRLALQADGSKKSKQDIGVPLYINSRLEAGENKLENINTSLAPDTPPGTYERYLDIGGKKRKVKMIVQPSIDIDVNPTHFTLQGTTPGTEHEVVFTVTNLGNLPFQIPKIKHVAALDMDLLCRAFGFAFRRDGEEGFMDTMDRATRNIKDNLANWADGEVAETGKIIDPGKSMLLHFKFTIPDNAQATNDYTVNARFWDKDMTIVIKSHNETQ